MSFGGGRQLCGLARAEMSLWPQEPGRALTLSSRGAAHGCLPPPRRSSARSGLFLRKDLEVQNQLVFRYSFRAFMLLSHGVSPCWSQVKGRTAFSLEMTLDDCYSDGVCSFGFSSQFLVQ